MTVYSLYYFVIFSATSTSLWPKWDTDYTLQLTKETGSLSYSWEIGLTNDKPKRITNSMGATYDLMSPSKKIGGQAAFKLPYMVIRYNIIIRYNLKHIY